MVLDPIPQSLPVHFFGSRPQPPTSRLPTMQCVLMMRCLLSVERETRQRGCGVCQEWRTMMRERWLGRNGGVCWWYGFCRESRDMMHYFSGVCLCTIDAMYSDLCIQIYVFRCIYSYLCIHIYVFRYVYSYLGIHMFWRQLPVSGPLALDGKFLYIVYLCMYIVCIQMYVFISMYSYLCIHIYVFISMYSYLCIQMYIFRCMYSYLCIHMFWRQLPVSGPLALDGKYLYVVYLCMYIVRIQMYVFTSMYSYL